MDGSDKIDKTIVYFKINEDFTIDKLYDHTKHDPPLFDGKDVDSEKSDSKADKKNDKFRWSIDISNMYEINNKHFVIVALSHINVSKDMKGTKEKKKGDNKIRCEKELSKVKYLPSLLNECELKDEHAAVHIEGRKGIAIYRQY